MAEKGSVKKALDAQREQWERAFSEDPGFFGDEPSEPARRAAGLFANAGFRRILELGSGQGRDTLFFAGRSFRVTATDYSRKGLEVIRRKAGEAGLSRRVETVCCDFREELPFAAGAFDACYSHMLFCMALTEAEIGRLSGEILRVLRAGGLNVYTVRSKEDAHFGRGARRGEDLYEFGGFIVHFFDETKVRALAGGYDILGIDAFEEGDLPRKLFRVTLRKR